MKEIALVFLGGGTGSIARYLVGKLYPEGFSSFPFATLTANFLSCLIFGLILILGVEKTNLNYSLKLLLITGFCGGFSTYSSFAFETLSLFRVGSNGLAIGNILLNFTLSLTGLLLGMAVARWL